MTVLRVPVPKEQGFLYAPQYAAIELGYFEEEGIDLTVVNGAGADKVMTEQCEECIKEKEEGPRHPLPITGFTSFCNLITDEYYILFFAKAQ